MRTVLLEILKLTEKFIDWFSKNISRIKSIGILLLVILFIISFINNGCNKEYANKLVEKITGLNFQNDILNINNKKLQDSLEKERIIRLKLESSKAILIIERETLTKENDRLKRKLAGIPAWLLNMPADSSYKFLNEIAYPYPGEHKFPFNEPQIKNIHADYLENASLNGLVANLEDRLINCELIGANRDSLVRSYKESYAMVEKQKGNLNDQFKNLEEKTMLYKDQVNKSEKKKKFWKATTGITVSIAIVLAILL